MRVKGYRSTVTLEDLPGDGTRIRWRSAYERAGPLTTVLLRLAVRDSWQAAGQGRIGSPNARILLARVVHTAREHGGNTSAGTRVHARSLLLS